MFCLRSQLVRHNFTGMFRIVSELSNVRVEQCLYHRVVSEVRGKSTLIYTGEQAGVSPGINQINDLGMCSNLFQKFQFLRTETLLIYNPIQNLFFVFLSFVS